MLRNERSTRGVRRAETICAQPVRQTTSGALECGASDARLKSSSVGSDETPDESRLCTGPRTQKLSTASASDISASSECVFQTHSACSPVPGFRKNASSTSLSLSGCGGGGSGSGGGSESGCAHFALHCTVLYFTSTD